MTKGEHKQWFQLGNIIGIVLPALLTVAALAGDAGSPLVVAGAGLAALVGMFLSETAFVRAGQSVPLS